MKQLYFCVPLKTITNQTAKVAVDLVWRWGKYSANMVIFSSQTDFISAVEMSKTCWKKPSEKCIPSGNQTWLAGKSPINGGFNRKITYRWSIVHCHVWLPEGMCNFVCILMSCFVLDFEMCLSYFVRHRATTTLIHSALLSSSLFFMVSTELVIWQCYIAIDYATLIHDLTSLLEWWCSLIFQSIPILN